MDALAHIKNSSDCIAVKNFANAKISSGHVRVYPTADGSWGDYHYTTGDIHIWTYAFTNAHELNMTLMHESYHGYYNDPDDTAAENFASNCVTN